MEGIYRTEREGILAKALLDIGGRCTAAEPDVHARMALDEAFPDRAEGSVMSPREGRPSRREQLEDGTARCLTRDAG